MPDTPRKFYLTTPIYYVNARPHIGHAYTTIAADVIARRHRLLGDDTFFLTGTDEHGQKIERSAASAGIEPQAFTDEVSAAFSGLWKRMGLTNDDFIRTTEPRHKQGAQRLFALLHQRGQIYLSSYTGQYSVGEEMFVDGPPGTIGPDGKPTETVTEENFFFKLSAWQLPVLDLIESDTLHIQPESRKNEVLSFIRGNVAEATERGEVIALSAAGKPYVPGALRDLSVSRSGITWGIPVPEPAASETQQKHVIYVWLDALANYMTAVGYGSDAPEDIAKFERYWPADLHLMSKEITRFHCVYWPAFLMAAGLPVPKAVTAHGWLLFDDAKMSKSKGNIVRTDTILDAFGTEVYAKQFPDSTKREQDLFATDVLRYFLLREIPFGSDGSFSFDAMITRYNADLANGYGNLVSRTLTMINSNFAGAIPPKHSAEPKSWNLIEEFRKKFERYDFSGAFQDLWLFLAAVDGMISEYAPWKLAKSADPNDKLTLEMVLYAASESIRIITALAYPALPNATAKVWAQLGLGDIEEAAQRGELKDLEWGGLQPGTKLGVLGPVFPRAEKGLAQIMIDIEAKNSLQGAQDKAVNLTDEAVPTEVEQHDSNHPGAGPRTGAFEEVNPGASVAGSHALSTERPGLPPHQAAPASGIFGNSAAGSAIPDTPQIAIDDFVKVDLRVAKVLVAERIPKADKLLRLEVDLGYEQRQILSGIAEWYTPEELIGRRIVIVANLAPRKMRGLESHGMLLAASNGENGKPILTTFGEDIELGSRVR
ncbi:methionine--tRNA ligase [Granulicella arctica]|uniref:Methionine--tRNA ligase n=1 Tax=Granulicella arctica TaxID=940613 RepID=A0A7Y9PIN1_9BACT|nr:methionine--tRNA ligase [Granulicella arctica]NYF79803.1 methionyl-tRNA synthetase [Granulicella arctica]